MKVLQVGARYGMLDSRQDSEWRAKVNPFSHRERACSCRPVARGRWRAFMGFRSGSELFLPRILQGCDLNRGEVLLHR
ncbi:hypothetical protein HRbin30_02568 [bacterium HR30]|nr:hypothetical protein HRbin30_02568 [bacterium HR30]